VVHLYTGLSILPLYAAAGSIGTETFQVSTRLTLVCLGFWWRQCPGAATRKLRKKTAWLRAPAMSPGSRGLGRCRQPVPGSGSPGISHAVIFWTQLKILGEKKRSRHSKHVVLVPSAAGAESNQSIFRRIFSIHTSSDMRREPACLPVYGGATGKSSVA